MIKTLGLSSERLAELGLIEPESVLRIGQEALKRLEPRLMDHGDRVAFIVYEMLAQDGRYSPAEIAEICQLAFFHDIGAYKTDEIDRMLIFESTESMEHSLYGYLFLNYFTPMGEAAQGVLYHHTNFCDCGELPPSIRRSSQLLHLADRIDILNTVGDGVELDQLRKDGGRVFDPELVELFAAADRDRGILARLASGAYRQSVRDIGREVCSDIGTAIQFLSMLVYIIDFKSQATVSHTINVVAYAVLLSRFMGMTETDQYRLYVGGLLHDVGKIAIPYEILEKPASLTPWEMEIMKTHVTITDEILRGVVDDDIRKIAARHHEKPDGSGYPEGLVDADLTVSEKIMAVADVMSALMGRRSYKEAFDQQQTMDIIAKMAQTGKLDSAICQVALENFTQIVWIGNLHCAPLLESYHVLSVRYQEMLAQISGISN